MNCHKPTVFLFSEFYRLAIDYRNKIHVHPDVIYTKKKTPRITIKSLVWQTSLPSRLSARPTVPKAACRTFQSANNRTIFCKIHQCLQHARIYKGANEFCTNSNTKHSWTDLLLIPKHNMIDSFHQMIHLQKFASFWKISHLQTIANI